MQISRLVRGHSHKKGANSDFVEKIGFFTISLMPVFWIGLINMLQIIMYGDTAGNGSLPSAEQAIFFVQADRGRCKKPIRSAGRQ